METYNSTNKLSTSIKSNERHIVRAGGFKGEIDVWDRKTGDSWTLNDHTLTVFNFVITSDEIVSCSHDNTIRFWDYKKEVSRITLGRGLVGLAMNEKYIVATCCNNTTLVFDAKSREQIQILHGHIGIADNVYLNGNTITTGSIQVHDGRQYSDSTILVQEVDGTLCHRLKHSDKEGHIVFAQCDRYIVSGGQDGRVCVWDIQTGEKLTVLSGFGRISQVFCDLTTIVIHSGDNISIISF